MNLRKSKYYYFVVVGIKVITLYILHDFEVEQDFLLIISLLKTIESC